MKTGQRNTVAGQHLGVAAEGVDQEPRTVPIMPLDYGPGWILLPTVKDAYTGRVRSHESDIFLYVKNTHVNENTDRVSYLGFDLANLGSTKIEDAELLLHFAPTGWGLASHLPDAEFSVFGLVGNVPEWDESILYGEFPGKPNAIHLGSFTVPQGRSERTISNSLGGARAISSSALRLRNFPQGRSRYPSHRRRRFGPWIRQPATSLFAGADSGDSVK